MCSQFYSSPLNNQNLKNVKVIVELRVKVIHLHCLGTMNVWTKLENPTNIGLHNTALLMWLIKTFELYTVCANFFTQT